MKIRRLGPPFARPTLVILFERPLGSTQVHLSFTEFPGTVRFSVMVQALQSKDDVFKVLQDNREPLRRYGVHTIGLFGSFVRGKQTSESDLDFLVEFDSELKSFDNFMALSFFLEELFDRQVDLTTAEALSPYIGPRILAETEYVPIAA